MVQPFPAVFNTLRQSIASYSVNNHIMRAPARVRRPPFPQDFFTPRARPINGVEKPQKIPPCGCAHCRVVGCSEKASALIHSQWCPKRNRLLMMTEVVPLREGSYRSKPSRHIPRSMRSHLSSNKCKRSTHLGQRRCISNLLDVPATSSDHKKHQETTRHKFLLASGVGEDSFDFYAVWDAYDAVKECGALDSLSVAELLSFVDRMACSLQGPYSRQFTLDAVHSWGRQLQDLLDYIEPRIARSSYFDHLRRCLLIMTLALIGNLQQATSMAAELRITRFKPEESNAVVRAYEFILVSTKRHFDSCHVLDFVALEWNSIGRHLSQRSTIGETYVRALSSLRERIYSILADIINPAEELRIRRNWNAVQRWRMGKLLVEVLCRKGQPEDALDMFHEMLRQNLDVPLPLQLDLVRALARADIFEPANTLFSSLSLFSPSNFIFRNYLSTGLYLFAQQGNISQAETYYARIKELDVVTASHIAMLLHVHALHGDTEKVTTLFHQFFPDKISKPDILPNVRHYTIVIFAHAQRGDFDSMNTWLKRMTDAGFLPDVFVYSIILKSFAERGEVDSVAAVLNQMHVAGIQPGYVAYTTVVTLLAERKDSVAAEAIYKRAVSEGVVPDRRMVTSLMNAHAESGSWQGVIRAFDYLSSTPNRRLRLTIEVYNTLLKAYVLIGAPFHVVSCLFVKLERADVKPDAYTFALLIQSACDAGLMDVASEIFLEMDKLADRWQSNLHINIYVLTIIMAGFLRIDDKKRALAVFEDMQRRGIQPTSITFGHILKSYANEKTKGSLELAETFLRSLLEDEPNNRTWQKPTGGRMSALEHVYGPLMRVYADKVEPEEVERLFEGYLEQGGEPTLGILTTLLHAHRRARNIDAVTQLWPQIFQLALRYSRINSLMEGSILPNTKLHRQANLLCIPLSIYIDALSAAGDHFEVAKVWRKLQANGFTFDSHNWNHLAVALVRAGEPERAFEILERVILPYQRKSERVRRSRDEAPETPLAFDIFPQEDDPTVEAALRNAKERSFASKLAARNIDPYLDDEVMENFAHPLHILYQISPAWNIWRPHAATLSLLVMVISHLELGMVVQPLRNSEDLEPLHIDREERRAMKNLASGILGKIYMNCPGAVRVVREFERSEKNRLGNLYNPYRKSYDPTTPTAGT